MCSLEGCSGQDAFTSLTKSTKSSSQIRSPADHRLGSVIAADYCTCQVYTHVEGPSFDSDVCCRQCSVITLYVAHGFQTHGVKRMFPIIRCNFEQHRLLIVTYDLRNKCCARCPQHRAGAACSVGKVCACTLLNDSVQYIGSR